MSSLDGLVSIKEEVKGDALILRLSGRLDAVSSPYIESKIFEHIDDSECKLLIDFSGVDYLSSAGLRMLLSISKKVKTQNGKMVLFSITTNVMEILKMSGFDHVLEIAKSEEEGFRKF